MKYILSAIMAAGWFCLAMAAFAQSTSPPQASSSPSQATSSAPQATPSPAPSASPAAANPSAGGGGKRAECRTAAQGKTGQDRQDQMQLCLAQARVDCLKQAIDQKVANDKRRDFIKGCMQED